MPYLMPNGKWRGKRMINGQVKTKVFSTKQDVKKWEAVQEASDWEAVQNSMTRTDCLHDFANAYLNMASERFAKKTFAGKKLAFKYLFRIIPPTIKPEDFTPHMALDALRSEVFRLQWEDVDLINRKVRFGTRKTGHGGMEYAWVPLTSSLHDLLAMRRITQHSTHVFIDPATGNPYTARQHFMKRLCLRAGVKPFGFHAVRHLAATILAYGGLDILSIQAGTQTPQPQHHGPLHKEPWRSTGQTGQHL